MRIALIVGHSPGDGGARNAETSEFDFYNRFVDRVLEQYRRLGGGHELIKVIRQGSAMPVKQVNDLAPDFFVSFHANASTDPAATGSEVLYYPSKASEAIARIMVRHIHEVLELPLRGDQGLVPRSSGRGAALLKGTRMPGCLVEPFFISNSGDWARVKWRYDRFVASMALAIDEAAKALDRTAGRTGPLKDDTDRKAPLKDDTDRKAPLKDDTDRAGVSDLDFVPAQLIGAITQVESQGNALAIRYEPDFYKRYLEGKPVTTYGGCSEATERMARATSWGPMQIMGETARFLGYDKPFLSALCGPDGLAMGCAYLRWLRGRLGENYGWMDVVAAYNGGLGAVRAPGAWRNKEYVDKVDQALGGRWPE